ncbi:hypothetical protein J3D54_004717 [Pseudomonas sp. GGS8]|uniref:zeta toxin family protein n=1 Tax=Pseudomonas sp. GGS8 TaxID=2817892 RepID=UPI00209D8AF9|nr:zeta toxin family protein [Pseudomonas sp. GGS8]MCP1445585.1 hypothetical protein [Pseudomonas sp. GGS8]
MSVAPKYPHTTQDVTAAFEEIKKKLLCGITAEAIPKMLVVAGLQGSGKTYLLENTLLPTKRYDNYVRLYLPEYRKKHPEYAEMIKQGVLYAYEHTEGFVREVSEKIFTEAFKLKYNIIMECAFDSNKFAAFPPSATALGYQFETHIVGCTQVFAHLSSIKRALKSLAQKEMERFLTVADLNASMGNAQAILVAFETAAKAISGSQITLYERGFGALKERVLRAQSTYTLADDGSVTVATSKTVFAYSVYASIINNVIAVNDREQMIKECHMTLHKARTHAKYVPNFVYNDLYACISKNLH